MHAWAVCFDPEICPSPRGPLSTTCHWTPQVDLPAKWHPNLLNVFSRIHECDRQTTDDRPRYREMCIKWQLLASQDIISPEGTEK